MSTNNRMSGPEEKTLWHITVDLAYEGKENDSCQDGVNRVISVLSPLIENDSGIKQMLITSLPEKIEPERQ